MTKLRVLVLGATGYIGSAIAEALRRAGHDVWCLVRAKDTLSASLLHQRGCRLFVGDVKDSKTWIKLADKANAIVFATNLRGDDITTLIEHRANKDLSATAEEPHLADIVLNKTIVYTSGCLVYGADTSKNLIDENSPLSPLAFVSWRPKIERTILSVAKEGSYFGRVVVIRPGFLYGLQGGYLEAFRSYTEHRTAEVVGGGDNFIPTVHAEDLADLYVRAVENPNASGCYNACSDSNDSYYSIIESTARAAAGGQLDISIQHRTPNPSNVMDQMLKVDLFVSSDRARSELGWTHRHLSLVEEADLHFESWKAFRAQQAFFDAASGASSSVSPAHGH